MGLLQKILLSGWRDHAARGDAHRDGWAHGLALQEYRRALASFDGTAEERELLDAAAATCRKRLRELNIAQAQTHAAEGTLEEALYAIESALDHSVTAEERRDIQVARRRLIDEQASRANPRGRAVGADLDRKPPARARRRTINYLVSGTHSYTMVGFLKGFGRPLHQTIGVVHYEDLVNVDALPGGTYIFSDLERLNTAQLTMLANLWDQLAASAAETVLLNHPTRTMKRYELLRALHDRGQNHFDVYRYGEEPRPLRRPVFLRHANEHDGSFSGLIRDERELDDVAGRVIVSGVEPEDLLVVEYCDTADPDGVYRKYSAFRVGDRLVPRHLIHSREWLLKLPDLIDAELLDEDRRYTEENPHEADLREIFELANVDYGRIDYSLHDGKIQVWEINTNPMVMALPEQYREQLVPAQERFAPIIIDAFRAIDLGPAATGRVDLVANVELMRQLIAPATES